MQVFRSSIEAKGALTGPAIAIGNFDGVHIGHQALFQRAIDLAHEEGKQAIALTFSPHPAHFFKPDLAPPLITTEQRKLQLMEAYGLDGVVIEPFDADYAGLTAEQFIEQVLVDRLSAKHVIVGRNFRFGRGRKGGIDTLDALGYKRSFLAHGVTPLQVDSIIASSTKIREFILMGRARGAETLLGRLHCVDGVVVTGEGRGRTIGVPTANLAPDTELIPGRGVYAGYAELDGRLYPSVINVGTAPTVRKSTQMVIETHVLDFAAELVGKSMSVQFVRHLRSEKRFHSLDELVEAIQQDIGRAREILECPAGPR